MSLPAGWSRHPEAPHHCLEHECGRFRISKAILNDQASYSVWMKDNGEWIRPNLPIFDDLGEATGAANQLIQE